KPPLWIEHTTCGVEDQSSNHWVMVACRTLYRLLSCCLKFTLKSYFIETVSTITKLNSSNEPPVGIERTTPGLQDQCSNH
ncbi:hypothetical protein AVEN_37168-1, partial [Araneus ventricosus]